MTYIKAVKTPLLVQQGENDIRVPVGQARQVVAALKQQGTSSTRSFIRRRATASTSASTSRIRCSAWSTGSTNI